MVDKYYNIVYCGHEGIELIHSTYGSASEATENMSRLKNNVTCFSVLNSIFADDREWLFKEYLQSYATTLEYSINESSDPNNFDIYIEMLSLSTFDKWLSNIKDNPDRWCLMESSSKSLPECVCGKFGFEQETLFLY